MTFEDIVIIINSSNRVNQITLKQLEETQKLYPGKFELLLAIPELQKEMYSKYSDKLLLIPSGYDDLPSQRQWCMKNREEKYVFFMDDDLTFLKRTTGVKLSKCDPNDIFNIISDVFTQLNVNNIPIVGVSTRLGNNRILTDYDDNCRVTRCYAINREVFNKVSAVFNPIPQFCAEDFHMVLSFLNEGYPNRVLYTYAQNDIGANATGGCSDYRTSEVHKKSVLWMAKNHPEVTVKVKTTIGSSWKNGLFPKFGDKTYRTDMVVGWKKAFKPKNKPVCWLDKPKKP